jgi:hypothetical protein
MHDTERVNEVISNATSSHTDLRSIRRGTMEFSAHFDHSFNTTDFYPSADQSESPSPSRRSQPSSRWHHDTFEQEPFPNMSSQENHSPNKAPDNWFEAPATGAKKNMLFGWSSSTAKRPLEGPVPRKLPPPPTIRSSTSRPRQRRAGPDSDDMSECTIDTSIRDHYNHHHHHNLQSPNVHSLIAELKLELANLKSDSDRACLKMKKMEGSLTEKDERIATLQLENRNLSMELRTLEKILLVRHMTQTVGVASSATTTPIRDTGCGGSGDTTATHSSSNNPFRTQFAMMDVESSSSCNLMQREGLSIEFNQDMMKSIHFADVDEDNLEEEDTMHDISVNHDRHSQKQNDSKSVQTKETSMASSSQNNNNNNKEQVEIYPDDDPFSTLNAEDDSNDVVKPAGWFRWGSVQSSK